MYQNSKKLLFFTGHWILLRGLIFFGFCGTRILWPSRQNKSESGGGRFESERKICLWNFFYIIHSTSSFRKFGLPVSFFLWYLHFSKNAQAKYMQYVCGVSKKGKWDRRVAQTLKIANLNLLIREFEQQSHNNSGPCIIFRRKHFFSTKKISIQ